MAFTTPNFINADGTFFSGLMSLYRDAKCGVRNVRHWTPVSHVTLQVP